MSRRVGERDEFEEWILANTDQTFGEWYLANFPPTPPTPPLRPTNVFTNLYTPPTPDKATPEELAKILRYRYPE